MSLRKSLSKCRGIFVVLCLLLPPAVFGQHYSQTNLVSSIPGLGTNPINGTDPQLVNSWGLTRSVTSPWWVADNGTGLSTLYNGVGNKNALVVTIPVPKGQSPPSAPTGVVFNGTSDFSLPTGGPARFIFVTEDGTIAGWNGGTAATIVVDSSKNGAVYKGCTIAEWNGKPYLYVANFNSGNVEVYDSSFQPVRLQGNAFVIDDDNNNGNGNGPAFQGNPRGFAPFNVQAIGTNVYVSYAKQDADKHDDVPGPGFGDVGVFDPSGKRLAKLQHGLWFNSPWGIAMAPGEFGEFSHALLVGMFGSGQIAAFNPVTGDFLDLMKTSQLPPNEKILSIDGLWALGFGAGNANSGPYNTLFFTAGPNGEHDGLFGTLVPIPAELNEADEP
jgi:uncharacterized protein (TIGR03118 family)